jgi:hypothetical protein
MMFPLSLVFGGTKTKKYLADTKEDCTRWVAFIRKVVGYANLQDFYELKVESDPRRA